jgi:secreted trypsin-like serine protease
MKTAMASVTGLERIIQGKQAPSPIPWQAHMRQGSPTGRFYAFCGGTILDSTTILTAAHCYDGKDLTATNYFIAAGATHVEDAGAQTSFVASITLHENYNPNTNNNDVAILKLKTPLTINDKVKPACLPAATLTPSGVCVASGWGLIGQEPNVRTLNLMYVAKPVIVNTQCRLTSWAPSQITDNMICAGDADGGESTCRGDSGGPLIVAGANDVATLIGTTSFGSHFGCGTKGWPAVYAYTIPFLDWITSKM